MLRGEGRWRVREDDQKRKKKEGGGEREMGRREGRKRKKQSNYQLGLEVVMKCNRVVRVSC